MTNIFGSFQLGVDISLTGYARLFEVFLIFVLGFLIYAYFQRKSSQSELILNESSLFLKDVEIPYDKIRSILKRKTLIGYSIDIYKEDKIFPVVELDFLTIHEGNAVYELIISEILNAQKKAIK